PDFFAEKKEASAKQTLAAIKKRIAHLIDEKGGVHENNSTMVEDILKHLKVGKTVVIDLSLKDGSDANIISSILLRKLFDHNKRHFTDEDESEIINCVVCIEEAQNVISEEFVKSNANPFVRVAKEGRKFKLGLIAITQRPSAIAEEIRSQAENFFAFYMGNKDDIKALVNSNINYDGVISRFLQTESIPGNLYMVSARQPFALPVRVLDFNEIIKKDNPS
ncbi:MAG: ATP-binding protein, partial [Endozoicomonadaceae bacterium]|nr:ATP-binding protein [Endozoicomonadaceae bacterium]